MERDLSVHGYGRTEPGKPVAGYERAQRIAGSRSNLLLANVEDPRTTNGALVELSIEVLDGGGSTIGSADIRLDREQTYFVSDVVAVLGGTELALGQIRVTRVGGTGVFAGVMTTIRPDGSVSSTVGTAVQ